MGRSLDLLVRFAMSDSAGSGRACVHIIRAWGLCFHLFSTVISRLPAVEDRASLHALFCGLALNIIHITYTMQTNICYITPKSPDRDCYHAFYVKEEDKIERLSFSKNSIRLLTYEQYQLEDVDPIDSIHFFNAKKVFNDKLKSIIDIVDSIRNSNEIDYKPENCFIKFSDKEIIIARSLSDANLNKRVFEGMKIKNNELSMFLQISDNPDPFPDAFKISLDEFNKINGIYFETLEALDKELFH